MSNWKWRNVTTVWLGRVHTCILVASPGRCHVSYSMTHLWPVWRNTGTDPAIPSDRKLETSEETLRLQASSHCFEWDLPNKSADVYAQVNFRTNEAPQTIHTTSSPSLSEFFCTVIADWIESVTESCILRHMARVYLWVLNAAEIAMKRPWCTSQRRILGQQTRAGHWGRSLSAWSSRCLISAVGARQEILEILGQ